jgi:hypothetical protein
LSPDAPETLAVLLRVVDLLEELGLRYHLGGSLASSIHGVPRQTRDIDVVLDLDRTAVDRLLSGLGAEFFVQADAVRAAVRDRRSFNVIHLDSGLKIDFFVQGGGAFDLEELRRSQRQVLQAAPERSVMVKSAEDTILRKLQWYRSGGEISDRQWTDVLGIVGTIGSSLDEVYLRRWAAELGVTDLLDRALSGPSHG